MVWRRSTQRMGNSEMASLSYGLNDLQRMRWIATGALGLMAAVYIAVRPWEARYEALGFVASFAEAAMVGALADWFAVVALFRHPMGIPLWHTAVLPRNKDRIGAGMANFVVEHFLTPDVLATRLATMDLAGTAGKWLTGNAEAVSGRISDLFPRFLHAVDDADIQRLIHGQLVARLKSIEIAPLAGHLLSVLASGDKYEAILSAALHAAEDLVQENREYLRRKIRDRVPLPDWPVVSEMKDAIAEFIADRVLDEVRRTLREARTDAQHEMRDLLRAKVDGLILSLRTSPEYLAEGEKFKAELLQHPALRQYMDEVWHEIKQRILEDLAAPHSAIKARVERIAFSFGQTLLEDEALRAKLNAWLQSGVVSFVTAHHQQAREMIEQRVHKWNEREMSEILERAVGRDLQFIRLNGTFVGGLVGLVLHMIRMLSPMIR
jgi:uncharacterized membrane-anchored protein YjiN (DUF445 family)